MPFMTGPLSSSMLVELEWVCFHTGVGGRAESASWHEPCTLRAYAP